jgi:hypothetical protein
VAYCNTATRAKLGSTGFAGLPAKELLSLPAQEREFQQGHPGLNIFLNVFRIYWLTCHLRITSSDA